MNEVNAALLTRHVFAIVKTHCFRYEQATSNLSAGYVCSYEDEGISMVGSE